MWYTQRRILSIKVLIMDENKKLQKIIQSFIRKATEVEIVSEVPLSEEQLDALQGLNSYCVSQVLSDPEVVYDPRKINYKANQELKMAVVAMCLAQSLINPVRRNRENKEFFEENINIYMGDEKHKVIEFGAIHPENVSDALFEEIIEDWKIYRDREGFGIKALIDEKTNLTGLNNFNRGGDPIYEFARFRRKYTEKEKVKEEKRRESAQEAFRNAMVQSLASEVARQQLLEGRNPLELLDQLFAPSGKYQGTKRVTQRIDPQIENNITKLLEHSSSRGGREER